MLVLARKRGEKIVCRVQSSFGTEEEIVICVASIRGDKVRLGFDAPRHVNIVREEVLKEDSENG